MEKTVVELFAGVGGFRCGLNNINVNKGKRENRHGNDKGTKTRSLELRKGNDQG